MGALTSRIPSEDDSDFTSSGRFAPGNKQGHKGGAPPGVQPRVRKLRDIARRSVNEYDIFEIMRAMVEKAKDGDLAAAREVLDRVIGKAQESEILERLEELEAAYLEGEDVGYEDVVDQAPKKEVA